MRATKIHILLGEKWHAYDAGPSCDLKEPGSWAHIKRRNIHKNPNTYPEHVTKN